jgi:rSAM/selenodomain-associated transferase 2
MLTVIIPALDEAAGIGDTIARLDAARARGTEVIVVDGGSADATVAIAAAAGVRTARSGRGRATQMNAGAAVASGDTLLFLHADTLAPEDLDLQIAAALASGSHAWGRFDVRILGRSRMLRVVGAAMNLRSRLTGISTGDQGLFVRRSVFRHVGGFPDVPLMEDVELCRRLGRISRPACLRVRLHTSGRRWETSGVWRTIILMWRLRLAYFLGAPPERLAQRYRDAGRSGPSGGSRAT